MTTVNEKLALIMKGHRHLAAQQAQGRTSPAEPAGSTKETTGTSMAGSPFQALISRSKGGGAIPAPPPAEDRPPQHGAGPLEADVPSQAASVEAPPFKVSLSSLVGRSPRVRTSSIATEANVAPQSKVVTEPNMVDPYDQEPPEPDFPKVVLRRTLSASGAPAQAVNEKPYDPDEPEVIVRRPLGVRGVSPAVRKPKVALSSEQEAVVNCDDDVLVVNAAAGSGKTTTAIEYAARRPREKMLYLCLGRSNADDAKRRFGANVDCKSTHQVAWAAMRGQVGDRLTRRWKPLLVKDQFSIPSNKMASVTMRILQNFWGTADHEIDERHAESVRTERNLSETEFYSGIQFARSAWRRMLDPTDRAQMPDDAYLKMFALKGPQLPYDRIIFDEAQDGNPVTLQIIKAQQKSKLFCIGDRHQSIYQFRGAVNAIEEFSRGATLLHLTQTWRFGPKIANLANLLLSEFKGETVPIQGMAPDGAWSEAQYMNLARTNAELFRMAAKTRGEGIHWVGGAENYRMDLVMDVYHLYSNNKHEIKDFNIRKFDSFVDYQNYADDAADGEARVLSSVVSDFAHETPDLIRQIFLNEIKQASDASMVLTTAHKAKGLEHNCVRIADDFEVLESLEAKLASEPDVKIPETDINLLYVALTRAKHALSLNKDTSMWLDRLDMHRANRASAVRRQESVRRYFSNDLAQ